MCGILCAINGTRFSKDSTDFITDGILTGAVRGRDSTGIVQVDVHGGIYIHKQAVSGSEFLDDKTTKAFIKDVEKSRVTIVHHRAATVGNITDKNAHPFICDMDGINPKTKKNHLLVGVHNGSLTNWRTKPNAKDYVVDSEWALNRIATIGNEAFKEIEGPYCFMWVTTKEPNKLYVTRNTGRPMHAIMSKDGTEMYFASETGMLAWLVERNKISVEDNILVLGDNHIYEFDMSDRKIKVTAVPRPAPVVIAGNGAVSMYGYTRRSANTHGNNTLNHAGYVFIEGVKDALKAKAPVVTSPAVSVPAVAKEPSAEVAQMMEDIKNAGEDVPWSTDDDDYFTADQVPTSWFSSRSAGVDETKLATDNQMFRSLEWFQGVEYDDATGELLGEIQTWSRQHGKVNHVAIMRGVSRARANAQYVDSKAAGDWVVVIGARNDSQLGLIYIVAELNNHGRQALEKQKAVNH